VEMIREHNDKATIITYEQAHVGLDLLTLTSLYSIQNYMSTLPSFLRSHFLHPLKL
jgi:uncharacterized membrane protein YhfC